MFYIIDYTLPKISQNLKDPHIGILSIQYSSSFLLQFSRGKNKIQVVNRQLYLSQIHNRNYIEVNN